MTDEHRPRLEALEGGAQGERDEDGPEREQEAWEREVRKGRMSGQPWSADDLPF